MGGRWLDGGGDIETDRNGQVQIDLDDYFQADGDP